MSKDARIGLITLFVMGALLLFDMLRDRGLVTFGHQQGLIFTQVHGLREGDLVTVSGVPAGKVVSIDFAPDALERALAPVTGGVELVQANVIFDNARKIPKESTYTVRTDMNGIRRIEITVSPSQEDIDPGETFFAEEPTRQEDQLQATLTAFSKLGQQTENLREILSDEDFRLRTLDTASNLRFYSRELRAASAQAPDQLRAFEQNLNTQEAAILNQLKSFDDKTKDVRERMTEMSPQLSETMKGYAERMTRQGQKLTATLESAAARSGEYQEMLDRMTQERLNPEAVQSLIVSTKKWARKLEEYRRLAEDVHALTSDPTVRSDLKEAIGKFQLRSAELNVRLDNLEKMVDENPIRSILGVPDEAPDESVPAVPDPDATTSDVERSPVR